MTFPYHPAANIMPAMSPEEFAELVASVSKNGLLEKIELFDGQVIDGRSRQEACKNLNLAHSDMYIQRTVHDFPNGCPYQYVWEKHLRRNLTPSQRGIVAAKMKDAAGVVNIHQSRRDRAKSAGVDKNTVQAAEEVIANGAKEVVELVEQGKLAVSQAKKLVEAVPDKKEQAKVVGAGKEEVKRRISGGVTFDVEEIEGAEAEPGRKPKNGAPLVSTKDRKEAVALLDKLSRALQKVGLYESFVSSLSQIRERLTGK